MNIQEDILQLFPNFPNNSRVWIYQSNRAFTENEAIILQKELNEFASEWTSHSKKVTANGLVLYNHFIVIIANENQVGVSGCSIDNSVKFIQKIESKYQLNFFDRFYICFLNEKLLNGASKNDFINLYNSSSINNHTLVFNNTVNNLYGLKNDWLLPLEKSWHLKSFKLQNNTLSQV